MRFVAQTMDLNHDGEVTVDEFVHYCRSQQGIRESMTVSGAKFKSACNIAPRASSLTRPRSAALPENGGP